MKNDPRCVVVGRPLSKTVWMEPELYLTPIMLPLTKEKH